VCLSASSIFITDADVSARATEGESDPDFDVGAEEEIEAEGTEW
jgi:hypothetical protein